MVKSVLEKSVLLALFSTKYWQFNYLNTINLIKERHIGTKKE